MTDWEFFMRRVWFVARLWPKGRKIGYGLRDHWEMSYDAFRAR